MKKVFFFVVMAFAICGGSTWRLPSPTKVKKPVLVASVTASNSGAISVKKKPEIVGIPEVGGDLVKVSLILPVGEILGMPVQQVSVDVSNSGIPNSKDGEIFKNVMQYAVANKLSQRPMSEIMQAIANKFLGASYQGGLLDGSNQEKLVVSLDKFDCVLFVETVLALARGVALQDYSYPTFVNHLINQRYRNGELRGYCSRLHYFSDWIYDNQNRGNVSDITAQLQGIYFNKRFNFMTQHRQSYPQLATNEANYQCMVVVEDKLNKLNLTFIPQNQIGRIYKFLQPGDIIGVATGVAGLDFTHTGLVYRTPEGNIGLIHASPNGAVKISPDLEMFVGRVQDAIGIVVARPTDPRQTISAK